MPTEEAITNSRKAFQAAGFEVADVVGNNFSITGSVDLFEKQFGAKLELHDDGSVEVLDSKSSETDEEGINALNEKLRLPMLTATEPIKKAMNAHVEEVLFSSPPDFGTPESFH